MSDFIKKHALLLIVVFAITSCEDVVEVDVPETTPRLVIEATFNRYFKEDGSSDSEGIVKLSLSAPFFAEQIPPALGAVVTINDPVNDISYEFADSENNGSYFGRFVPDFNIPYELKVVYQGEIYESTTAMMPTGELESILQGDKTLFGGDDKEVIITFKDSPSERNYYLIDLDVGNFLITDDEFYDGNSFVFSYFYEDLKVGDELNIRLFGVDKRFSNFFEILQTQSGADGGGGGGPFATPSGIVRGNVINTTNVDNYPFGYFRISEGDKILATITR